MKVVLLILLCGWCGALVAQENKPLQELRAAYESFEYRNVVQIADKLLLRKERLTEQNFIDLYIMKAVAHFSLSEEDLARRSFFEILFVHNDFQLDSTTISPKIIDFFTTVQSEFQQIMERRLEVKSEKKDSVIFPQHPQTQNDAQGKSAMLRSLILPGWGHFYSSDDTKGYILSSLSAVTLGVMIYSIFDTQTKENEYLAETTPLLIQEKYGQYNSSYKTRNILIASYALLWMYSQIDLLYFSANNSSLRISVSFEEKNIPSLSSRLKFAFPISR